MADNEFARKVRDLRAKNNLTLEQVAVKVGVGSSTVRKWETGMIENIRRDKIAKLAYALNTTPEYLMGWEPSHTKNEKVANITKLLETATDEQLQQITKYIKFALQDD